MPTYKIAFYLPNLDGGGAERVMLNLANGIANLPDTEVDFAVAEKKGPLLDYFPKNVNLIDLGSKRIATSVFPLSTYIRKSNPDVLVSALGTANIIAIAANLLSFKKTKLIVTQHTTLSMSSPTHLRARLLPRLISLLYPCADGRVAVSGGVADDLASVTGLKRSTIEVIYNPVITPDVQSLSLEPCLDKWITDSTTPVLLGIGRLNPQKDFKTLLEAVSIVNKKRPVKLIILGEGELREELETLIADLQLTEQVKMPGFVKNPYCYMRNAQLFVLSSLWEGLPTVLIEALFCNTRLVSTDCPSGPKEILDDGRYGLLVKPGDPRELADGIMKTLDKTSTANPIESWERYTLKYSTKHYLSYMFDNETSDRLTRRKS